MSSGGSTSDATITVVVADANDLRVQRIFARSGALDELPTVGGTTVVFEGTGIGRESRPVFPFRRRRCGLSESADSMSTETPPKVSKRDQLERARRRQPFQGKERLRLVFMALGLVAAIGIFLWLRSSLGKSGDPEDVPEIETE